MFTRIHNFTYGDYQIANIDEELANNNIELILFIKKYESENLRMILGECLYAELMDNVEIVADATYYSLKSGANPKWGRLLNGITYDSTDIVSGCGCGIHSDSCAKHTWDGLVRKIATIATVDIYETVMASYIFYKWSLSKRTLSMGTGEGKITAQNTTQESTANKRADAWNKMVQDVDYGYPNTRVSLNQFLKENSTDYPKAQTVCLKPITYYDI
jgi:hypothetical protein